MNAVKNVLKNKNNLLGDLLFPVSFLITFVIWMAEGWKEIDGIGDFFGVAVMSVIGSVFTFWIVAIGLLILAVPVRLVIDIVQRVRQG